jgi:Ala-tRNA(Pro) deacylase
MLDPPNDGELAPGEAPASPARLFDRLRDLGIDFSTMHHPPVFTVEEAKTLRGEVAGCHTKNLFLRDKKGRMWLVVCQEDRSVDLKDLAVRLGAKRLSFGSAERLMRHLGVIPGAVTPFAVVNDTNGDVRVAIDRGILERGPLNFHPLDNAMTTSISAPDFLRFLEAEDHAAHLLDFERRAT